MIERTAVDAQVEFLDDVFGEAGVLREVVDDRLTFLRAHRITTGEGGGVVGDRPLLRLHQRRTGRVGIALAAVDRFLKVG